MYEPSIAGDGEIGGLLEYWQVLRRRKGTVLINALLCTLAAFLLTRFQAPVYEAATSLQFQGLNERFLNITSADPFTTVTNLNDADLQTQIELLHSRRLIGRVVSQLKLGDRPESAPNPSALARLPKVLGLSSGPTLSQREQAVVRAEANLKVKVLRGSHVVMVVYSSGDPRLAADFVNMLCREFIEQNLELRLESTRRTGEWLARQLDDLKIKLQRSEDELQAYALASGLLFTGENDSVAVQKLKQLQAGLAQAQAERMAKQSRYEMVKVGPADSLPEVLDSTTLRDYQVRLTNLRQQLADLRSLLTPTHYKVKQIEAQIAEVQTALTRECANIINRITNEYESTRRREQLFASAYASQAELVMRQDARAIHYKVLKQDVDTNSQLYEAMLQKVKEASIVSAMRASNVVVVDPAEPPARPASPKPLLNLSLGLLTGVFFGITFAFLQEHADSSLKTPGESALYLKLPELGVIPSESADTRLGIRRSLLGRHALTAELSPGEAADDNSGAGATGPVELITWRRAPSLIAEAFRATCASILFTGEDGSRPHVIAVTSAGPREGKTTATTNLGIALARTKRCVLLIDGDLRSPRLHEVFGLQNSWGLSNVLSGTSSLEEGPLKPMMRRTEIPGLYVLTTGSARASASDLLYSPHLAELIGRLRQEFDALLIDTPPLLQLADARVLGHLADAVILVCRAGETDRRSALTAAGRLAADGIPVLGTILNDWNPDATGYYPYYRHAKS